MSRPKRWYDPEAATSLRVIARSAAEESYAALRWRHALVMPTLGECLVYPLTDGPGLGLLFFLPPILWVLSLPIFDCIAVLEPLTKSDWALGLLIMPVLTPMVFSFAMVFGYILLFLGHVLVASASGENDHPRWPEWHPSDISEGIGRWFWAILSGALFGAVPLVLYWMNCGQIDWLDWIVFIDLLAVGVGYAQMALAAALLHDSLVAANPLTVLEGIYRLGWAYLKPCLVATAAVMLVGLGVWSLLYKMPRMWMEALALWSFWFFTMYAAMVVMRMLGLTYYANSLHLHWFRRRPQWATSSKAGRIYANS